MPQTNLFTLNAQDVADILKSTRSTPPVCLVALDCNWGPPVSGRFDSDFLQVWAGADTNLKPKRVSLLGARDNLEWNIEVNLDPVSTVGKMQLFFVALGSQLEFPNRFVIRMESNDGSVFYDNNGGHGVDYRLVPYGGRMTLAVIGDGAKTGPGAPSGAIWLLPMFTSYRLAAQSESD